MSNALENRLKEYQNLGLIDSEQNAQAINEHFAKHHPEGEVTVEIFDGVIKYLSRQGMLAWAKPAPPPSQAPTEPEQPEEELGTLPNGEPQISLYTAQWEMKNCSKAQLMDWLERKRKAEGNYFTSAEQRKGRFRGTV